MEFWLVYMYFGCKIGNSLIVVWFCVIDIVFDIGNEWCGFWNWMGVWK